MALRKTTDAVVTKGKQSGKSQIRRPYFHPAFGSRPAEIIGRDAIIDEILQGLAEPIGSRKRCTFLLGQRGMGKTSLLLELADKAQLQDFVCVRVTSWDGMSEQIIEGLQLAGAKFFHESGRKIQGASAGALGFSVGLTFEPHTQESFGFRIKLGLICDRLAQVGKGVLILIDEAQTSEQMRQVATAYQELIGEDKNLAMVMAGLPNAVSSVLNDSILTFLNRATKIRLGPVSEGAVLSYYTKVFKMLEINAPVQIVQEAAVATGGFPYLIQLIGYYLVEQAIDNKLDDEALQTAIMCASADMDESVFRAILAPFSKGDISFLRAVAACGNPAELADVMKHTKKSNSALQPYRARMIEAGVIESPAKGQLVFAVPGLADYLLRTAD